GGAGVVQAGRVAQRGRLRQQRQELLVPGGQGLHDLELGHVGGALQHPGAPHVGQHVERALVDGGRQRLPAGRPVEVEVNPGRYGPQPYLGFGVVSVRDPGNWHGLLSYGPARWTVMISPVSFHRNQASPATSSGDTIQCSATLLVVMRSASGSRPNSYWLTGYSSGQPSCVHMSPAMWASMPSATHNPSTGTCHGVTRARSQRCQITRKASAIPAASP